MDESMEKVMERVTRFLSYRDRSSGEVIRYLRQKKIAGREGEAEIVAHLTDLGLLDDARFARNRARYRARNGHGPAYIRADLMKSGIPRELIDSSIADLTEEEILEGGVSVARPRWKGDESRESLLAYLLRRGYTHSQAKKVVSFLVMEKDPASFMENSL